MSEIQIFGHRCIRMRCSNRNKQTTHNSKLMMNVNRGREKSGVKCKKIEFFLFWSNKI